MLNRIASYTSGYDYYSANIAMDNVEDCGSNFKQIQSMADISNRLQDVPMSTVWIAPNILEEMSVNRKMYDEVMSSIDIYVKNYRQYNIPGYQRVTFTIDNRGVPTIKGVNEQIEKIATGGNVSSVSRSRVEQSICFDIQEPVINKTDSNLNLELIFSYYYNSLFSSRRRLNTTEF